MMTALQDAGSSVMVVGESGIGKSSLAIECLQRLSTKLPECHVGYIQGSSVALFEEDLIRFGRQVSPKVRSMGQEDWADALEETFAWLQHNYWLLLVDNACNCLQNKVDILRKSPTGRLANTCQHVEGNFECITLKSLSTEAAVALLQWKVQEVTAASAPAKMWQEFAKDTSGGASCTGPLQPLTSVWY